MKKEPLDKTLFKILACPTCKSNLNYNKDKTKLICSKCKQKYEIKNNIPILLSKS